MIASLILAQESQGQENSIIRNIDSLVGTWELIAIVERGTDVTEDYGVTRNGKLVFYQFSNEGSFSISAGGEWFESGTWSVNTDVSPMHFYHTPSEAPGNPEIVGEESLGIFEIGGGVVKMCVADDPPDIRPETFDTNTCMLFVMRRNEKN